MARSVWFVQAERVKTKAIFRDLPGWRWDEGVWVNTGLVNKEFKLPEAGLVDFSNIPESFYRSGVLGMPDLELEEVNFVDEESTLFWSPAVKKGGYAIYSTKGYLHSDDSILLLLGDQLDDNGRSSIQLATRPNTSSNLVAQSLTRDPSSLAILVDEEWNIVQRFRGLASNGIELDTEEDPTVTDTSVKQAKLVHIPSAPILNLPIQEGVNIELTDEPRDVWTVTLESPPVSWWEVKFSRTDIFRTELPYDVFTESLNNPMATPLEEGDYAIGYSNIWASGVGVKLYSTVEFLDYGTVSYKPSEEARLLFNQDARGEIEVEFMLNGTEGELLLSQFPVQDLSYYENGDLAGELVLDEDSLTLTVDGDVWTRVTSLDDADPEDEVFELNPLFGIISFGDGGVNKNGLAPIGEVVISYTRVPLIQYDREATDGLFQDDREDLDPQVNGTKNGFLVLDTRRLTPYKIYLRASLPMRERSAGTCCIGPLNVPPSTYDDFVQLKARVVARGNPERPVANVPVQFRSLDGLVSFSQEGSVTDGDGWAYTEAFGISNIGEYIISNYVYEAADLGLNPNPGALSPVIPPWGALLLTPTEMVFPEAFNGELEEVYMLIQSIPSHTPGNYLDYNQGPLPASGYLTPYNSANRRGGITVVWSRAASGAQSIVHPIEANEHPGNPNWTIFKFANPIPTGRLIVAYKLVIDRSADIVAETIEDPYLISNQIKICLALSSAAKGQWKLPNLPEGEDIGWLENPPGEANLDSSMIGTAVFMSPNDFEVTDIEETGGGSIVFASVGDSVDIIGENFPTQEELKLSVFIIKDKAIPGSVFRDIEAIKDITSEVTFIDSTTIRIPELPTPPTEEYDIDYWIVVGGFHMQELDSVSRKTAIKLEIREAP